MADEAPGGWRTWDAISGPVILLVIHAIVLWVSARAGDVRGRPSQRVHSRPSAPPAFFSTAALFWWALIHGRYGRLGYGVAVLYVFATAMHTQILRARSTFGTRAWYPTHAARTAAMGVNPVAMTSSSPES